MNNFVNDSSQYAHQANEIYDNIENNFRKVMGDMETFTKHTHYIANDYGKMHDKYTKMVDKCKLKDVNFYLI